jgi:hypothetical protein
MYINAVHEITRQPVFVYSFRLLTGPLDSPIRSIKEITEPGILPDFCHKIYLGLIKKKVFIFHLRFFGITKFIFLAFLKKLKNFKILTFSFLPNIRFGGCKYAQPRRAKKI